jgi:hypothetical protein
VSPTAAWNCSAIFHWNFEQSTDEAVVEAEQELKLLQREQPGSDVTNLARGESLIHDELPCPCRRGFSCAARMLAMPDFLRELLIILVTIAAVAWVFRYRGPVSARSRFSLYLFQRHHHQMPVRLDGRRPMSV